MREFTDLERAVLNAVCDGHFGIANPLRDLLATAQLSERDNTGHGFYTSLKVEKIALPLDLPERLLNGPNVEVPIDGAALSMGFIP